MPISAAPSRRAWRSTASPLAGSTASSKPIPTGQRPPWPLRRAGADCSECHARNGRVAALAGFYMPGATTQWLDLVGYLLIGGTFLGRPACAAAQLGLAMGRGTAMENEISGALSTGNRRILKRDVMIYSHSAVLALVAGRADLHAVLLRARPAWQAPPARLPDGGDGSHIHGHCPDYSVDFCHLLEFYDRPVETIFCSKKEFSGHPVLRLGILWGRAASL